MGYVWERFDPFRLSTFLPILPGDPKKRGKGKREPANPNARRHEGVSQDLLG